MNITKIINGKRYRYIEEYPRKDEAQKKKRSILDQYKSVRIVKRMADRRYERFQVWAR